MILHVAFECPRNLITCDGIWVVFVPFYMLILEYGLGLSRLGLMPMLSSMSGG